MERERLPFSYSTKDLAIAFERETFKSDISLLEESNKRSRLNLKSVLNERFPGNDGAFTKSDLNKFIKTIANGELSFGYLTLMLQDEHPLVKNWEEKQKRSDLHYLLGIKILALENRMFELEVGIVRYGNEDTVENLMEEMKPYKNFQNNLLPRVTPTPEHLKK